MSLQRVLIAPHCESLLKYCTVVAREFDGTESAIEHCRAKLALPPEELNPPPLLSGDDLKQLGLRPGPHFKRLLDALRDAQLDKLVQSREDAIAFIQKENGGGGEREKG